MSERNASLVLKTSDLTQNSSYLYGQPFNIQHGSMNAKSSSITWNNINLRVLLGDMYDKYDLFNICLNTISTSQANTIDVNPDSRNVNVKISGLPFINQTYNVKGGSNSSSTTIATFNFVPSNSTTQYYYSNNMATFGKNSDVCNITIEYFRIVDDTIPNSFLTFTPITNLTGTGIIGTTVLSLNAVNSNIYIGSTITGAGIQPNTYVTLVLANVLTLSQALTATINTSAVSITPLATYPNTIFVFDIFGINKDSVNPNGTRLAFN